MNELEVGKTLTTPQPEGVNLHYNHCASVILSTELVKASMASAQAFAAFSLISRLIPRSFSSLQSPSAAPALRPLSTSLFPTASISLPAISLNIPALLSDIWEGVLRAVPKKKTSHMKRRHRQLAGKALKDVKAINSCPACGEPKRVHHLCEKCVEGQLPARAGNDIVADSSR
jgi:large subunit ribosomal protein L32